MKYVIINRRPYRVCIYNTLINHEFLNLDYKQTGVGGVDSCVGAAPVAALLTNRQAWGEMTVGVQNLIPNTHCILRNTRTVSG